MKRNEHIIEYSLLALLFGLFACNQKAPKEKEQPIPVSGEQTYADTASSFVKVYDDRGRLCVQQSNTYYELVNVFDGAAQIPFLLKINKVELCIADSVNKKKVYNIEAKSILDTKAMHWTASFVATSIQFKDNTLLATLEGSGENEDYLTRYSLLTGEKLFSCSYGDMQIAIPNVKTKRFVGYTSWQTVTEPVQSLKEENLIALIQYASSEKAIDEWKLKLKRSAVMQKIPRYTPEMLLVPANDRASVINDGKGLILMHLNEHYQPADVKDFSVQYIFYFGEDNESTKITIPVKDDRLDLKEAQYDKDIFELTK